MSLISTPSAAFDPLSLAIWASLDHTGGENVFEEPAILHEHYHYAESLCTPLGMVQGCFFHDYVMSTLAILSREPCSPPSLSADQESARIRWFTTLQDHWFGELDRAEIQRYQRCHLGAISAQGLRVAGETCFSIDSIASPPSFVVKLNGDQFRYIVNGNFVHEVHARSAEALTSWAYRGGGGDESVYLFHEWGKEPYSQMFLHVSSMICRKFVKQGLWKAATYDLPDTLAVVHACATIAMHYAVDHETGHLKHHPGDLFCRALPVAIDCLRGPGFAFENSFEYVDLIAAKLSRPRLMDNLRAVSLPLSKKLRARLQPLESSPVIDWFIWRTETCEAAIDVLDQLWGRNLFQYFNFPIDAIGDGRVDGPLLIGPTRVSGIEGSLSDVNNRYIQTLMLLGAQTLWRDEQARINWAGEAHSVYPLQYLYQLGKEREKHMLH